MPSIRIFWTITAVSVMALALVFFPIDSFETYGIPCAIALGISVGFFPIWLWPKLKILANSTPLCTIKRLSQITLSVWPLRMP